MAARYEGVPLVELLADGTNVTLKSELTFYDAAETRWSVPAGAVVDGATIPRALWSLVGSPLTGRYRNAAIIHDWFCDRRTRSWQATHRVFYDAMIVSGVTRAQAKIMYFAVWWQGPRWVERVTTNANLSPGDRYNFEHGISMPEGNVIRELIDSPAPGAFVQGGEQERIFDAVAARIAKEEMTLGAIEELAERERPDV